MSAHLSAPSLATPAPTKESCSEDESSSDADEESKPESEETLKKGGSTLKRKQKNGENKKTYKSLPRLDHKHNKYSARLTDTFNLDEPILAQV